MRGNCLHLLRIQMSSTYVLGSDTDRWSFVLRTFPNNLLQSLTQEPIFNSLPDDDAKIYFIVCIAQFLSLTLFFILLFLLCSEKEKRNDRMWNEMQDNLQSWSNETLRMQTTEKKTKKGKKVRNVTAKEM